MERVLKDWKTSILGLLMAILVAIQPLTMNEQGFDFQRDWMQYLVAAAIAIVGFIMRDPKKKDIKDEQ